MKAISILLITVTLLAGIVGCEGEGEGEIASYDLTISSTTGGSVTTPGEGTFAYDEGAVVTLIAEADEGYYFVGWIGDVGTVDNVGASYTTITVAGDYEIIANFDTIDSSPCDYDCQQATPGGRLSYDFFGEEPEPTFSKYEVVFNWTDTPELYEVGIYPALLQFYFENGGGGYIGPQIEVQDSGETVEKIIFTIWSMSNEEDTTHPYLGDCSNPDNLAEGRNTQCRILDNAWIEGKPYKVTIEKVEELEDGVVWGATITDLEAEVETLIGQIKLDDQPGYKGYGLLDDFSWGFLEYYYGNTLCLEAEYGKIIRIGPVADDEWLPEQATYWHSECIRATTYSPQMGVIIEEVGEGVCRDPEEGLEGILWDKNYAVPLSELPEELQELFE